MSKFSGAFVVLVAILLGGCQTTSESQTEPRPEDTFVTIGTGGLTGVYYPTGGAICRLVNKNRSKHGVRCSAESTKGSIDNLTTIRAGNLDMGIAQSDWQYRAYTGTVRQDFIAAGPHTELRSIFSVHAEPVTIIARADAHIQTVDDLVGKRVNIGNSGSGTHSMWKIMWGALGYSQLDLKAAMRMRSAQGLDALCDNKIDATMWLVGHPSNFTNEAITKCDGVLVEVSGAAIDKLVAENSFYRHATIPGGMYRGNRHDTATFGVGATFVTSSETPESTVYHVVKSVFDNFRAFKKLHPAFKYLDEREMVRDSLSAPLHDGAAKYYRERDWIE